MERKRLVVPPTPMSSESDYEFWEDFDKRPLLKLAPEAEAKGKEEALKLLADLQPLKHTSRAHTPAAIVADSVPESHPPPKLTTVEPVLQTSIPDTENATPASHRSLSPPSEPVVEEVPEKQEPAETKAWQSKLDSMLTEVSAAKNEASRLQTIVFEQEMMITRLRGELRDAHGTPVPRTARKVDRMIDPETDTKVLQSQIEAFNDLLEYYQKQADDYKKANSTLASELSVIHSKYTLELNKLKDSIRDKEEKLTSERDKLLTE